MLIICHKRQGDSGEIDPIDVSSCGYVLKCVIYIKNGQTLCRRRFTFKHPAKYGRCQHHQKVNNVDGYGNIGKQ